VRDVRVSEDSGVFEVRLNFVFAQLFCEVLIYAVFYMW
jgi:hypothetical protein